MKTTLRRCLVTLAFLVGAAAVWAQIPADGQADTTQAAGPSGNQPDEAGAESLEQAPEPDDVDSQSADPLAVIEAEEAAQVGEVDPDEVMDRFEPSERISEDRSVAFPNDI